MAVRRSGQCIFTEQQQREAGDMLKAILIKVFIDHNITFDEFSRKHRDYMLSIGSPFRQITSSRNNLLKVILYKESLTYRRFEMILKDILGMNLTNMKMTLKDTDGKDYHVSLDRMTF